jgi:hypothetical protein
MQVNMPTLNEWLFGKAPSIEKLPTGTPQQGRLNNDLISQLMQQMQGGGGYGQSQDYLSGLFGQDAFQNFSEPFNQQFQQQFQQDLMPRIAERFAGYGNSSGALSSTGFGQALGGAAAQGSSNLQAQLAQLFSQLQMQGAGQLSNNFNQQAQLAQGYQPFAYHEKSGMQGNFAPMMQGAIRAGAGMA